MPNDLRILKYYFWDQFYLNWKRKKLYNTQDYLELPQSIGAYINNQNGLQSMDFSTNTFTIFDLETTGFFPQIGDEVLSIGAIKVRGNQILFDEAFYTIMRPLKKVPRAIQELTGLTTELLENAHFFPTGLKKFLDYSQGTILVAHPASFDIHFLQTCIKKWKLPRFTPVFIDSHELANQIYEGKKNYLDHLIHRLGINERERHHALNDAIMTAEIFIHLIKLYEKSNVPALVSE